MIYSFLSYTIYNGAQRSVNARYYFVLTGSTDCPKSPTDWSNNPTDCPKSPTDWSNNPTNRMNNPTDCSKNPTDCPKSPTDCSNSPTDCSKNPTDCSKNLGRHPSQLLANDCFFQDICCKNVSNLSCRIELLNQK